MRSTLVITICESHVNTRLRYALKSTETSGFLRKPKATLEVCVWQKNYVLSVHTDLNALNGELPTKNMAYGVDLQPLNETRFAENVT